ncbi:MAG: ABC transporter permease [Vicinamibacterales bacterium]
MGVTDRVFRALLRLLPEEARAGYERDMAATFRAEARDAARAGRWRALARLWTGTIGDLLKVAPAEHVDILVRDIRFASRTLAARPALTLTAVATLALGLGANVAMFAVVDAVLLRPLPYKDPSRLVIVRETSAEGDPSNMGYLTFEDLRTGSRSFDAFAAASMSIATVTGDGRDAERINAMRVSASYFDVTGVRPAIGRAFTEAEDRPGTARRVVILSDSLWRRRFDGDPAVIGRPLLLSGTPFTVVGIMPRGFEDLVATRLYEGAEMWVPLGYDPAASFACRTCRHLRVFGRLAAGVTPPGAARELGGLISAAAEAHPLEYHEPGIVVSSLGDYFLGPVRTTMMVLWIGVGLLLVVACGNVANLLLLRASERRQEVAIRTALGVTTGRLARQLLTESFMLALMGSVAGLLPAWAAIRLLTRFGPDAVPRLASATLDARAVIAGLILVAGSALLFGLAPLRLLARRDVAPDVHGAGRRTAGAAAWRIRAALVGGNVTMAVVLVIGAGLLVRTLDSLLAVEPGFDPRHVMTMSVNLTGEIFRGDDEAPGVRATAAYYEELLTRVRALPGVESASAVTTLPLGGGVDGYGLHVVGRAEENPEATPYGDRFVVTPGFVEAMRIPLLAGRTLGPGDGQGAPLVVLINERMARELFAGQEVVGQQLRLGGDDAPVRTIVGVVGNVRHMGLDEEVGYQFYAPQAQWPWAEPGLTLVVRAAGDPGRIVGPVREIIRAVRVSGVDPAPPVTAVARYEDVIASSMGTRPFAAWLLVAFAAAAVLLAAIGLGGALGVLVGQRQREIGVRLALGARAREIRALILREGLRPVLLGLAAGLAVAAAAAGTIRSLLFGVDALDPMTFAGAALLLLAVSVAACAFPARRAARIDPATTLRME